MRKWINIVESAVHKGLPVGWPPTLEGWQLVSLAKDWHHTPEDFQDGDIEHNILSYGTYHLKRVPLSDLGLDLFTIDDDLVRDYAARDTDAPPIIVSPQFGIIIDGNHRANAAAQRGENDILAYVGEIQTYDPPSEDDDEDDDE